MFHVKRADGDTLNTPDASGIPQDDTLTADERPVLHRVKLPVKVVERPLRQVAKRLLMALLVLVLTALVVYADRAGYHDSADDSVDLLDSFYYATVTLSTTGYGDITPVSDSARLTNIFVITPLRVLFLIILVGTTLEVLTERTREEWRLKRWRSALREHTVVVGFGTKGRSAVQTVCATGLKKEQVVVVDPSAKVIDAATADGYAGVMATPPAAMCSGGPRLTRPGRSSWPRSAMTPPYWSP